MHTGLPHCVTGHEPCPALRLTWYRPQEDPRACYTSHGRTDTTKNYAQHVRVTYTVATQAVEKWDSDSDSDASDNEQDLKM